MNQSKKLIVMAGGTGGHVIPGITVSHHLMNCGWKVRWLGTADRIEASLVPKYGIEIDFISISGLRGKNISELLKLPVKIFHAWHQSRNIMIHFNPDVVLGMGGYVSGPGGLAAWTLGIPIVIHEQNSIAGMTNKLLAKIASKVLQAFPSAFKNAEVVGNPIRIDILTIPKPELRLKNRKGPLRILVLGGSQGAKILNQTMPKVANNLREILIIWHQSGEKFQNRVRKAYADIGQYQHMVTGFINNIAKAYSWADIVICRSGALTVSEIIASGLPAIFVPFNHKDRQQYWNAYLLERVGAAKVFEQSKFTANSISFLLSNLDRKILLKMADRARSIHTLNATELIAKYIKECS